MSEAQSLNGRLSERRIRFVDAPIGGDVVLMQFKDPGSCYAVVAEGAPKTADDFLDLVLLPLTETAQGLAGWMPGAAGDPDAAPPVYVKSRGVELLWRPGRAVLQCDAGQAESLFQAVVEFAHYERELRRVEEEIAEAWGELDEDRGLAFDVSSADLRRSEIVGRRMDRTLRRRMRLARIEPHLYLPDPRLSAAAQKLGDELRQRAQTEARAETVDGQIEVFEHVYEMASQRMGEYRAARQGNIMEWVIVVLLAAEALLMLVQALR